jgi:hypothetical protein
MRIATGEEDGKTRLLWPLAEKAARLGRRRWEYVVVKRLLRLPPKNVGNSRAENKIRNFS